MSADSPEAPQLAPVRTAFLVVIRQDGTVEFVTDVGGIEMANKATPYDIRAGASAVLADIDRALIAREVLNLQMMQVRRLQQQSGVVAPHPAEVAAALRRSRP